MDISLSLPNDPSQWQHFKMAIAHNRMPQSLLIYGPSYCGVELFAEKLVSILLCHEGDKPCSQCHSCHLLKAGTHPDFKWIKPERSGGGIKIDQIRTLQEEIYHTPNCGNYQVVLITSADKMNSSSANALLKILEEPPTTVYFILVAEQLSTIPATVLSRCQKVMFSGESLGSSDYFLLGNLYNAESSRGKLLALKDSIINELCEVIDGASSPCSLASTWSVFEFQDLVWILHLITAQAIQVHLVFSAPNGLLNSNLSRLITLSTPLGLFKQLETLNTISKKLSHNISMNTTLTLEDLFVGYFRNRYG